MVLALLIFIIWERLVLDMRSFVLREELYSELLLVEILDIMLMYYLAMKNTNFQTALKCPKTIIGFVIWQLVYFIFV